MRNEPTLKTLCRGLEILEYLAERPEGATNKEVASYFGMDPSSSFRFLQTLVHCRFVCKENGKYYLSHRLLGLLATSEDSLIRIARPLIQFLAEETGFTAGLAVLENLAAVPVVLAKGKAPLLVNSNLGRPVPLHASALGKVLLAYLSDIEQEQMLQIIPLRAFTQNTIVGPEQLRKELASVRSRGYAVDNEEYLVGVRCIAVPLLDPHGACHAAISVSYPSQAFEASAQDFPRQVILKLKTVAEQIAQAFQNLKKGEVREM